MAGTIKLILLSEQFRGKVFELTRDLYTVGRIDERDICVKDPSVSSYHCDFVRNGSTYLLRDRNSTNGSRVNNNPVTEQELKGGDIIQIGNVEMLFDCETKSSSGSKTMTGITFDAGDIASVPVTKVAMKKNVKKVSIAQIAGLAIFGGLVLAILILAAIIFIHLK